MNDPIKDNDRKLDQLDNKVGLTYKQQKKFGVMVMGGAVLAMAILTVGIFSGATGNILAQTLPAPVIANAEVPAPTPEPDTTGIVLPDDGSGQVTLPIDTNGDGVVDENDDPVKVTIHDMPEEVIATVDDINDYDDLTPEQQAEIDRMNEINEAMADVPGFVKDSDRLRKTEDIPFTGTFYYTIERGDTLQAIASFFEVPIGQLIEMNYDTVTNPNWIYTGHKLLIPTPDIDASSTQE